MNRAVGQFAQWTLPLVDMEFLPLSKDVQTFFMYGVAVENSL